MMSGDGGLPVSDVSLSAKLKENYDSYYDGRPSDWRALGAIDKVDNIRTLCDGIPHADVLEIGSGDGAILDRLSRLAFASKLYSVEISQSAIATIKARSIPYLYDCQLFDGYALPYPDRAFDLSILSHILEHVEHPRQLLREASRVSEYIFVEVPLEDTLRLKPDYIFDRVGHINFYSWKTVRRLIQTCDLQVVSQVITNPSRALYEYASGSAGTFKHIIKDLLLCTSSRVASRLFTYHCSLLCKKISS
ncbi:MAG TPA: class I SAM-dependent methyltransferase [Terriglobales bacterium]|nr:class I SAM-dependent methyltransferase [Terriglobales bacterium]